MINFDNFANPCFPDFFKSLLVDCSASPCVPQAVTVCCLTLAEQIRFESRNLYGFFCSFLSRLLFDERIQNWPSLFDKVGESNHEYIIGNIYQVIVRPTKIISLKQCFGQWQKYYYYYFEQSRQKLGTFLENKVLLKLWFLKKSKSKKFHL